MTVSVTSSVGMPYLQTIKIGKHTLYADTTVANGGGNTAPTPGELLLGALGSCTAMTIQAYAEKHKLPVTDIKVDVDDTFAMVAGSTPGSQVKKPVIEKKIEIKGNLTAKQKTDLERKANLCHVNGIITRGRNTTSQFDYVI